LALLKDTQRDKERGEFGKKSGGSIFIEARQTKVDKKSEREREREEERHLWPN
jgi:hypothetical protein